MNISFFLRNLTIGIPIVALGIFALGAPEDLNFERYCLFYSLGKIFPVINFYAEKSAFPSVAKIYFSFAILLMPLHFLYAYKKLSTPTNDQWFRNLWFISSRRVLIKQIILVVFMLYLLYFLLYINPGFDFKILPINSSRYALAIGGWIFLGGIQGVLMAWVLCNLMAFNNFLRRS